jgi:hypothetical protein
MQRLLRSLSADTLSLIGILSPPLLWILVLNQLQVRANLLDSSPPRVPLDSGSHSSSAPPNLIWRTSRRRATNSRNHFELRICHSWFRHHLLTIEFRLYDVLPPVCTNVRGRFIVR